jgi:hypothetical protein
LCACARDARPAADYEPCDCRTTTSNVPRRQTAIDSLPTYHFTCPVTFPSDKDLPLHHVPAGCDPPETDADITRVHAALPLERTFAFIDEAV